MGFIKAIIDIFVLLAPGASVQTVIHARQGNTESEAKMPVPALLVKPGCRTVAIGLMGFIQVVQNLSQNMVSFPVRAMYGHLFLLMLLITLVRHTWSITPMGRLIRRTYVNQELTQPILPN